jgi:hypothetical protein
MKNIFLMTAISLAFASAVLSQELVDSAKVSVSPSGNFQVIVAPLIGKDFEYEKALLLMHLASKKVFGLGQNSRTFGVSWSQDGGYVAVANNGASKENKISIFKLDEDTGKIREVVTTPKTKNRTVWEVVEWKERENKVALLQRSEDEPAVVVWLAWK